MIVNDFQSAMERFQRHGRELEGFWKAIARKATADSKSRIVWGWQEKIN